MSEKQVLSSVSSNSSDSEDSSSLSAMKLCEKSPTCEQDALPSAPSVDDGAAGGATTAVQPGGNAVNSAGLAEGLDRFLQKQRSDLLFELRKLQHGHRPVTNTDSRETLEEFFSDALQSATSGSAPRRQATRPASVLSEVQGLVEQRPVTSVLGSQSFRRNLEDVIRGTLVRQDRELQQAIRLQAAGFSVGNSRAAPSAAPADPLQQHLENMSQLSHSSRASSSSHTGLAEMSVLSPPQPPPLPPPVQPMMPAQSQQQPPTMQSFRAPHWQQNPYPQQQWQQQPPQFSPGQQQQQPWQQQQQQPWQQQQQQQQPWQQQQQLWQQQQQPGQQQQQVQQPVLPQQPWLIQNSSAQQANGGMNMVAYLQHVQREDTVFEISDLIHRQVVSSVLNSDFRGTLENTMLGRLQHTDGDGMSVQNFIQSLQQSTQHQRNDFSHLGIYTPTSQQSARVPATGPATLTGAEVERMRHQMQEMQTMLRLTFELQMDMQRSIRQEVAAALSGQHQPESPGLSAAAPMPPSQPASEGQCIICLEKSVDAVLYQCGHMCCCLSCGLRLKGMGSHCPMCRAPIRDVIRAYRCQRD